MKAPEFYIEFQISYISAILLLYIKLFTRVSSRKNLLHFQSR